MDGVYYKDYIALFCVIMSKNQQLDLNRPLTSLKEENSVDSIRTDFLDIDRIDTALLSLLEPRLLSIFKYVGGPPKWLTWTCSDEPGRPNENGEESMSLILLRGCMYVLTLVGHMRPLHNKMYALVDGIQTPAMRANDITIKDSHPPPPPSLLASWQRKQRKIKYFILLSVVGPALRQLLLFLHTHYYSSPRPITSSTIHSQIPHIAYDRQRKVISFLLQVLNKTLPLAQLSTLITFLYRENGPTSLALYFTQLQYSYKSLRTRCRSTPRFNPFYAHRRTLYDHIFRTLPTFTQILASFPTPTNIVFPMDPRYRLRRLRHRLLRFISKNINPPPSSFPKKLCCLCHSIPCVAYEVVPCAHIYCYTCLRQAVVDSITFHCHDCGFIVQTSRRRELVS